MSCTLAIESPRKISLPNAACLVSKKAGGAGLAQLGLNAEC